MKLQTKLIIAYSVIVLFMGISQSVFLESRIRSTFQEYLDQHDINFMIRMEQTLVSYYEETGSWKNAQQLFFSSDSLNGQGPGMMRGMFMSSVSLLLLDLDGTVIADSEGTRIGTNGNELSGKRTDLIINGKKRGILVLQPRELQNLEETFLKSSNTIILISGLIAAVVSALFSVLIARKISKPLKVLMAGIRQIASGKKVKEINISTKDEFYELGTAFNEMARKLERNEEVRRSLVADVAHELRTPLTILQGKLESIQEGVIQPTEETVIEITDEVYRLNRLVKDLQQLSLAEAGKLPLKIETVDIKQLIDRVCGHLQWLADEKGITLRYDQIPSGCYLQIDADRMTQVIVNLIGNALSHMPARGLVEISVQEKDGSVFIRVSDTGPGISGDVLPFIFNRFYKGDPSRSRNEGDGGTGLGLSIVKGFVEAHGGIITVKSEMNKGTAFTITLPTKGK